MFRIINNLKNRKGFTLIELIVVLAVLAIIMAIAVPRFIGVREQAKLDSDMATLDSIAKLAELEFVRQNLDDDNDELEGTNVVANLINSNFKDDPLFQSKELEGVGANNIKISFVDQKVDTIEADGVFSYDLPSRVLTLID
jgi:type IV pilus assembly protein PilA